MDLSEFQRRIEIYVENELPSAVEDRVAIAAALAPRLWPLVNQWQTTARSTSDYVRGLVARLLDDWPQAAAQLSLEETGSPSGWWPDPPETDVRELPLADGSWSIAAITYLPGDANTAPRLLVTTGRDGEVRTIRFDGVTELEFEQVTTNMPYSWIIESLEDRGWDVLRYEVSTGIEGVISFFCSDMKVIGRLAQPSLAPPATRRGDG